MPRDCLKDTLVRLENGVVGVNCSQGVVSRILFLRLENGVVGDYWSQRNFSMILLFRLENGVVGVDWSQEIVSKNAATL